LKEEGWEGNPLPQKWTRSPFTVNTSSEKGAEKGGEKREHENKGSQRNRGTGGRGGTERMRGENGGNLLVSSGTFSLRVRENMEVTREREAKEIQSLCVGKNKVSPRKGRKAHREKSKGGIGRDASRRDRRVSCRTYGLRIGVAFSLKYELKRVGT